MFSTLQFQQQDLIKGLYFNLSTVPATYPPPSSPPVQFLETLVPARLAGCDPRYRALSYFQLTSSLAPRLPPTAGYTPWGEPDNRNWPLSEETIPTRSPPSVSARFKLIRAITGADRDEGIYIASFSRWYFSKCGITREETGSWLMGD